MTSLQGLSAFPITPMSPEGQVDAIALRGLLARLVAAGVDSIGLLGSTGSYPYLARDERRRAVEVAVEAVGGRVPILVGVGALRTDEAVQLARDAREIGAAAGLLAPVSYTPLTDDEVFEHFAAVARESGLPLCVYDNPGTTHFTFGEALVGRLAHLPGIVAVKSPAPAADAVARHLAGLRAVVGPGFRSATASTGTRPKRSWPAARPGTASRPGCSRSPASRSCGRYSGATPPRPGA